jgi:hypothetical protein
VSEATKDDGFVPGLIVGLMVGVCAAFIIGAGIYDFMTSKMISHHSGYYDPVSLEFVYKTCAPITLEW